MSTSINPAKAAANRRNALRSTGPKDTTSTRFNAATHGLSAEGITEFDDADAYAAMLQRVNEAYHPVGDVESFLVKRIAFSILRLQRAARMETEYITSVIHPPVYGPHPLADPMESISAPLIAPGLPARIDSESVEALVNTYQRYESAIENKLYRAMSQLERLRRMRQGEPLPASVNVDVAVHTGAEGVASFRKLPEP